MPGLLRFPEMTTSALHALPVHSGLILAEHLKAIQAQVPSSGLWMMSNDHSPGNEPHGVTGPALKDRKTREIRCFDNFLADGAGSLRWAHVEQSSKNISPLPDCRQCRWIQSLYGFQQLIPNFRGIPAERHSNSIHGSEQI